MIVDSQADCSRNITRSKLTHYKNDRGSHQSPSKAWTSTLPPRPSHSARWTYECSASTVDAIGRRPQSFVRFYSHHMAEFEAKEEWPPRMTSEQASKVWRVLGADSVKLVAGGHGPRQHPSRSVRQRAVPPHSVLEAIAGHHLATLLSVMM